MSVEAPTPRRLEDARRRGLVAVAPELMAGAAAGAALAALGPAAHAVQHGLAAALALALQAASSPAPLRYLARSGHALATVVPPVLAVLLASLLASLLAGALQTRFLVVARDAPRGPEAPGALARLGRGRSWALPWTQALQGLLLATAGAALAVPLVLRPASAPRALARALADLPVAVGAPLLALAAVLGLGSLLLRRHLLHADLQMTRAERQREQREDEGDPQWQRARRRARAEATDEVARSCCVVLGRGALAVALGYGGSRDEVPVLRARGPAPRILARARRAGVPVVEDDALCQELAQLVPGVTIPESSWEPVARLVIQLEAGRNGRRPPGTSPRGA